MEPANLTEAGILEHSFPESFRRGQEYFARRAVVALTRQGDDLLADVEGSHGALYRVTVRFQPSAIEATCSCPYEYGGWCKHIVAALLAYLDRPEAIEEQPKLEDRLGRLDRDQLQTLVLQVVRQQPVLADVVGAEVTRLELQAVASEQPAGVKPAPDQYPPVDIGSYRRRVQTAVHGLDHLRASDAYGHVGAMTDEVSGIVDEVWERLGAGDVRGAIVALDAITAEYLMGWTALDDSNGEVSSVFDEIGAAWTELVLTADLTPTEREELVDRLDVWVAELEDYGVESFWLPLQAARQGWDHPRVQAALRGEYDPRANVSDDELVFDAPLIEVRLNVLERRGDVEGFLNLARVAQHHARYAAMLARLGRIDEAAAHARERLEEPGDVLAVVLALWEQGAQEEALALAEHGLALPEAFSIYGRRPKLALATWLREQAASVGQPERALRAAVIAFQQSPDLPSYLKVQELAGAGWPEQRAALLQELRLPEQWVRSGHVEIWLHEGMIDEAIAEVERGASSALLARVARAAVGTRPEWAIRAARPQAERIMDEGRAGRYRDAIGWLEIAQAAYPADRLPEWRAYLDEQIERHKRKYKLRPMLEELRQKSRA